MEDTHRASVSNLLISILKTTISNTGHHRRRFVERDVYSVGNV